MAKGIQTKEFSNQNQMTKLNAKSLIFISALLCSCVNPSEKVWVHSLNGVWSQSEIQKFQFEINEAQNPKNIIFVVRNNSAYPYQDLKVKVVMRLDSTRILLTEQVDMQLAEEQGHWLGSGFGNAKELLFEYKSHYKFPQNGLYTLEVFQEMEDQTLKGIEDFGIKIQTAQLNDGK